MPALLQPVPPARHAPLVRGGVVPVAGIVHVLSGGERRACGRARVGEAEALRQVEVELHGGERGTLHVEHLSVAVVADKHAVLLQGRQAQYAAARDRLTVSLLLRDAGIDYGTAVIGIGILMIVYVVFGGMLATTWVQIVKAVLLIAGTILLSILVLAHFDFSFATFFEAIGHVSYTDASGNTYGRSRPW